jgi:hypothetical protein
MRPLANSRNPCVRALLTRRGRPASRVLLHVARLEEEAHRRGTNCPDSLLTRAGQSLQADSAMQRAAMCRNTKGITCSLYQAITGYVPQQESGLVSPDRSAWIDGQGTEP